MANLILRNVSKAFGTTDVIKSVNLEVSHGEFVVFVGPSGCGKSTLLRLITGLEEVTDGQIIIEDRDVTYLKPSKREVAMVFQSYALFPHLSVAENIGFGLKLSKVPKDEISARVNEVASILRVENLLARKPRQLSGGQRQRVAIGRSIIRQPKVFLFDEPLSNLDAALRVVMRIEITRLHQNLGATMIYVTHDQTEAMTLADRIVVLNEGRIEQVGSPLKLYENPINRFVAGFIGSPAMNFIKGTIDTDDNKAIARLGPYAMEVSKPTLKQGMEIEVGIRPEHIAIVSPEEGTLTAAVEIIEKLGVESMLYLKTDASEDLLTVRTDPKHTIRTGDRLGLKLPESELHFFDQKGDLV